MVSNAYRHMEDQTAEIQTLHDDLVKELSYKLKLDETTVKEIIYYTCVTTTLRPVEVAHIINEFNIHMHDMTHPEDITRLNGDDSREEE